MGKIYYHVRFDKILPGGCADVNDPGSEWDFRSLKNALSMISQRFGFDAECWRVEDLTDRVPNLQVLETALEDALQSCYQNVIMTFKDDAQPGLKYDHYKFFIAARDDEERPHQLSFSDPPAASCLTKLTWGSPSTKTAVALTVPASNSSIHHRRFCKRDDWPSSQRQSKNRPHLGFETCCGTAPASRPW